MLWVDGCPLTEPTVTRRLPLDKPEYLWYLRGAYIGAQLLIVAIYYFTMMKVCPR